MSLGSWDPAAKAKAQHLELAPDTLAQLVAYSANNQLDELEKHLTGDENQVLSGLMKLDHGAWQNACETLHCPVGTGRRPFSVVHVEVHLAGVPDPLSVRANDNDSAEQILTIELGEAADNERLVANRQSNRPALRWPIVDLFR